MKPEEIKALSKFFEKQAKLTEIKPGAYDIHARYYVEIDGTVIKGESSLYTPTVSIPLKPTLAIILHLAGFQRENAKQLLIKAVNLAIANEESPSEELQKVLKDFESAFEDVEKMLKNVDKKYREGRTTTNVIVKVEPADESSEIKEI